MSFNTVWPGQQGRSYTLETYPIGTEFKELPGVYIFCKRASNGNWDPLYVGETHNFNERLNTALQSHQAWPSCARLGATHLAVIIVAGARDNRLGIEWDLRHALKPPCNQQAA